MRLGAVILTRLKLRHKRAQGHMLEHVMDVIVAGILRIIHLTVRAGALGQEPC